MFTLFGKFAALNLFLFGFLLFCANQAPTDTKEAAAAVKSENPYRQTRFGWQDSRLWTSSPTPTTESFFHPGLVSLLLVFGTLGAVIWSSEEDEIAQLFGKKFVSTQK